MFPQSIGPNFKADLPTPAAARSTPRSTHLRRLPSPDRPCPSARPPNRSSLVCLPWRTATAPGSHPANPPPLPGRLGADPQAAESRSGSQRRRQPVVGTICALLIAVGAAAGIGAGLGVYAVNALNDDKSASHSAPARPAPQNEVSVPAAITPAAITPAGLAQVDAGGLRVGTKGEIVRAVQGLLRSMGTTRGP